MDSKGYTLHFFVGLLIVVLFPRLGWKKSLLLVFTVAVGKEIYDFIDYGGFSFGDILFTVLGACLALFLNTILNSKSDV